MILETVIVGSMIGLQSLVLGLLLNNWHSKVKTEQDKRINGKVDVTQFTEHQKGCERVFGMVNLSVQGLNEAVSEIRPLMSDVALSMNKLGQMEERMEGNEKLLLSVSALVSALERKWGGRKREEFEKDDTVQRRVF